MPGTINAPTYGDPVPENDKPYTIVKINYVKKSDSKVPKPLNEPPERDK